MTGFILKFIRRAAKPLHLHTTLLLGHPVKRKADRQTTRPITSKISPQGPTFHHFSAPGCSKNVPRQDLHAQWPMIWIIVTFVYLSRGVSRQATATIHAAHRPLMCDLNHAKRLFFCRWVLGRRRIPFTLLSELIVLNLSSSMSVHFRQVAGVSRGGKVRVVGLSRFVGLSLPACDFYEPAFGLHILLAPFRTFLLCFPHGDSSCCLPGPRGVHESSLPVAYPGYQVLLDIFFRLGLIANALTQCSS